MLTKSYGGHVHFMERGSVIGVGTRILVRLILGQQWVSIAAHVLGLRWVVCTCALPADPIRGDSASGISSVLFVLSVEFPRLWVGGWHISHCCQAI